jgi:Peptidase M15
VSPLVNSRRSARSTPSANRTVVARTSLPVIAIGFGALLGTAVLAVVDRSGQRAASVQTDPNRTLRRGDAVLVTAPTAPAAIAVPAKTQGEAPVLGRSGPALFPANGTEIAPAAPRPVEIAAAPRAAAAPAAPAEGPVVTASLAQSVLPARPVATPPQGTVPAVTAPAAVAPPGAAPKGLIKTDATASTDCLPAALRAVLADVAARFGEVTVVSTHQLNTGNHSAGSIREKLHTDCRAVDVRPDRTRIEEIKAYLRTRPEINGVESYRNGVVHMDVSATAAAGARPRPAEVQAQAPAQTLPKDISSAAPPQEVRASAFTPVPNERYR